MVTVGLPEALFHHQHGSLWEDFLRCAGCSVVKSGETNREILDKGIKCCTGDACLPVKAFHGHVESLVGISDYVFVPRYTSLYKGEFSCPKFCALPEMTEMNLKRRVKIISMDIHKDGSPAITSDSIRVLSKRMGVHEKTLKEAYINTFDKKYSLGPEKRQENTNARFHIAVLGHPYMIKDSYLSMKLVSKLSKRGIGVYTTESISREKRRENAQPYKGRVFWEIGLDNLGSASYFSQNKNVRGIIYLTPFACGIDSFVIEFIERHIKTMPFLKLTIDEHSGEAGFDTRLEAFLDMMG